MANKSKTPKAPASPWSYAIALVSAHGLVAGARVCVRESREGGYRILGKAAQVRVTAWGFAKLVQPQVNEDGSRVQLEPAAQAKADEHLQWVFKHTITVKEASCGALAA